MHSLQDYDSRGNRLSATKQNGVVNAYQYDPHGSVVSYGNTTYQYDAFGNQLTDNNTTNPFRYCGEYFDEETGFVYLRNRYYDTTTGRFITEDPVKDGLNWYVYCANNPVMFVDPSGFGYEEVEKALSIIAYNKTQMSAAFYSSETYKAAYNRIIAAKESIKNDVVYIESWSNLRGVLEPLITGDNNSLESIKAMKDAVTNARIDYDRGQLRDDIIFIAGLTTVALPAAKLGVSAGIVNATTSGGFNFAKKAAQHMAEKARYVPISILKTAIEHGREMPDPQGSSATMYYIEMIKNGKVYTLEVLYDKASNTILHFLYK